MNPNFKADNRWYGGSYEWKGKDYVVLGGIHYLVRWESDTEMVLTRPYGKVAYIAPMRNGDIVGLPVTKGKFYSDEHFNY